MKITSFLFLFLRTRTPCTPSSPIKYIQDQNISSGVTSKCVTVSALKPSLKTVNRLQLDQTKTAKGWTCSLGLSVLRLEDHKKTSCGGPVLLFETGLLYPYNYPSNRI